MSRTWLWVMVGGLVALVLAGAGGCQGGPAGEPAMDGEREQGLQILAFLDAWGQVGGQAQAFSSLELREDPTVCDPDGDVSLHAETFAAEPLNKVQVDGAAHKGSGRIYELSVYWAPAGPVTEDKLRLIQPFYDTLAAVLDPSLSAEDRVGLRQALKLRPEDFEALKQLTGRDRPRLTLNGIEYSVSYWGSEEGGTVELRGTVLEPGEG